MSTISYSLAENYASIVTNNPNMRASTWTGTAIMSAKRRNIFAKFEGGENSGKAVLVKNDFKKGKGDKINFTSVARLGGRVKRDEDTLTGNEEQAKFGSFALQIGISRHAVAVNKKFDLMSPVLFDGLQAVLLGDHAGWVQESDMMITLRGLANPLNTIRPGNKGSAEALRAGDTITPSVIQQAALVARLAGAKASVEVMIKEWMKSSYIFISPDEALTDMKQSSEWFQAASYAAERGDKNPLYSGEYPEWDGNRIVPYVAEIDDSNGPVGSTFNPTALLGNAITAGTGVLTITGGGNPTAAAVTNAHFFQYFPNYAWKFSEDLTTSTDAGNYYVMVYNLADSGIAAGGAAAGDTGKFGFYMYNTNGGNTLTTAAYQATNAESGAASGGRLGGTANSGGGDTRHTTVGNITWNASYHTAAHAQGSLIISTNSRGIEVGWSVLLGAESVMRGYGANPFEKTDQKQDYGFIRGFGYEMTYGQTPFLDTNGQSRRFVLVQSAITRPGIAPQGLATS